MVPVYVDGGFSPSVPIRAVGREEVNGWTDPMLKAYRTRKWKDWGVKEDLLHKLLFYGVRVN